MMFYMMMSERLYVVESAVGRSQMHCQQDQHSLPLVQVNVGDKCAMLKYVFLPQIDLI